MRDLIEAVPCRDRTDPHRLEQDIVAQIACHAGPPGLLISGDAIIPARGTKLAVPDPEPRFCRCKSDPLAKRPWLGFSEAKPPKTLVFPMQSRCFDRAGLADFMRIRRRADQKNE
jgi:hypothetical protein